MKRLYLILLFILLSSISFASLFSKLNEIENPNGKPWDLTIAIKSSDDPLLWDVILPVKNFLTIKIQSYHDYKLTDDMSGHGYLPSSPVSGGGDFVSIYEYSFHNTYMSDLIVEFHIPLSKLFKK